MNIDSSNINIQVVGKNPANINTFSQMFTIDQQSIRAVERNKFVHDPLICVLSDLLVIDIDSYGANDTSYLTFLATSFTPTTPVLLITSQAINASEKQRYLSGGAQAVIQLSDSSKSAGMIA